MLEHIWVGYNWSYEWYSKSDARLLTFALQDQTPVKLLVQPGDGVQPLVQAINRAKSSVEIAIFRFDRAEVEKAMADAVSRGVTVHALIAGTNRGGEKNLRKLEMRLLDAGVTVARTADDLVRYHGKYMIVDRKELYVLAFNYTHLDIEHSRSFGLITNNPEFVQEAVKLFEADAKRQQYTSTVPGFVVSPVNARKQLAAFIQGARKELLIYDPEISDLPMIRLLDERAKAGVTVRIIGRMPRKKTQLELRKLADLRLHTRTIIRDGHQAFVGSQSLREVELGSRREVGLIFRDTKIVARIHKVFTDDWTASEKPASTESADAEPAAKAAKRVAKAVTKDMPSIAPFLEAVAKELVGDGNEVEMDSHQLEQTVKDAVKDAVREVVRDAMENMVEQNADAHPETEAQAK
jgi:cardiolipin synthase